MGYAAINDSADDTDLLIQQQRIEQTVTIITALIDKGHITPERVAGTLKDIHDGLAALVSPPATASAPAPPLVPAVPVKKSVQDDFIICLEDGKRFKSLKRHIGVEFGLSPDQYRAKWGLPADYPMVAPNYAIQRSELAKTMGLGRKRAAA